MSDRIRNEIADDDDVKLSDSTLKILEEFYKEKQCKKEEDINEDWQLSQFWYDKETTDTLTQEVIRLANESNSKTLTAAFISCPTLFKSIKSLKNPLINAKLFEYDSRFKMFDKDFIFYDYNHPLDNLELMKSKFDLIIADPPYLAEECMIKTSMTIRHLAKSDAKLIFCTGAVMSDLLKRLFGVRELAFQPRHENNLGNEFKCYLNYTSEFLK